MSWVVIVLFFLTEVDSVSQRKSIKHGFVLFRSVMMKCLQLQSSNHWSTLPIIPFDFVDFYNFVGHITCLETAVYEKPGTTGL